MRGWPIRRCSPDPLPASAPGGPVEPQVKPCWFPLSAVTTAPDGRQAAWTQIQYYVEAPTPTPTPVATSTPTPKLSPIPAPCPPGQKKKPNGKC
jgi:hypothetical protein